MRVACHYVFSRLAAMCAAPASPRAKPADTSAIMGSQEALRSAIKGFIAWPSQAADHTRPADNVAVYPAESACGSAMDAVPAP